MKYLHNDRKAVLICSAQLTVCYLIDKGLDTIATNQEAIILISQGIALAFICWGLGRGIREVLAELKQ